MRPASALVDTPEPVPWNARRPTRKKTRGGEPPTEVLGGRPMTAYEDVNDRVNLILDCWPAAKDAGCDLAPLNRLMRLP
jgi:hypothetical protein